MIETLEQLCQHIRQVLPQPKALTQLRTEPSADAVIFTWNAQEYVVKKTLEVFQLKGQNLLITGVSLLMQAALRTSNKKTVVLGSVLDTMRQAEDLMKDAAQRESGLKLLVAVKAALRKQATA